MSISYASEDRSRAKVLAEALEAYGWEVWWDRKIPIGKSFHEVIEKAIADSNCMVVLWSRYSASSDWVRNEAEEGKQRAILAPALLENVTMPLGFRHLQAANLSDWEPASTHPEFNQLVESITRILGTPPVVPAKATSSEPVMVDRDATHPGSRSSAAEIASRARPGSRSRKIRATLLITALGILIVFGVALILKWQDESAVRHAITVMRESAEAGHVDNQYRLAEYYSKGQFVSKNDAEAMKWYRMAAENGHPEAQYEMGNLYAEGQGVRQDDAEAARWYRKAAEQGDARAQGKLGARYALGQGLKKDEAAAAYWLRKAAVQGDAQSQTLLGFMYADGRGVPEDDAEAVKWWREAARQGESMAQKQLRKHGLTW